MPSPDNMRRENLPRIMGVAEIRGRLGLTRRQAEALIRRKGFPEPDQKLLGGRVWLAHDVEAWIRAHWPRKHPG